LCLKKVNAKLIVILNTLLPRDIQTPNWRESRRSARALTHALAHLGVARGDERERQHVSEHERAHHVHLLLGLGPHVPAVRTGTATGTGRTGPGTTVVVVVVDVVDIDVADVVDIVGVVDIVVVHIVVGVDIVVGVVDIVVYVVVDIVVVDIVVVVVDIVVVVVVIVVVLRARAALHDALVVRDGQRHAQRQRPDGEHREGRVPHRARRRGAPRGGRAHDGHVALHGHGAQREHTHQHGHREHVLPEAHATCCHGDTG